jgi:hypothetical protein
MLTWYYFVYEAAGGLCGQRDVENGVGGQQHAASVAWSKKIFNGLD